MPELKEYKDFLVFAKYNNGYIEENPFMYFNLRRTIDRVLNGEIELYKFFNVLDQNNFISCLLVKDECLIYARNVNEEIVSLVEKGLEFHKFKRYTFFGTKSIIDRLFTRNNVKFNEQKCRNYYECIKVKEPFNYAYGTATMGEDIRINELIELGELFKEEFYNKEKPTENIENVVYSGLLKRNLFQWVVGNKLAGMAQVIYEEYDYPVIGYVITHPDFRGIGIASSLIHEITKGLLDQGHQKCWLMTDAYNPSFNSAFKKVGYELISEYVMRYKEE